MKTQLQSLIALGVQTLSVQNHEATAVNPYDSLVIPNNNTPRNRERLNKWNKINALPPLPCPSVPDGTYEIDRFKSVHQYFRYGRWNEINEKNYSFAFDTDSGHETRVVLVLSEPVAESEEVVKESLTGEVAETKPNRQARNVSIENLLRLTSYHKGKIVNTASLMTADIEQARASNRMYVDENNLGYVWLPEFHGRFPETEEEVKQFEKWYPLTVEVPEDFKPNFLNEVAEKPEGESVWLCGDLNYRFDSSAPPEAEPVASARTPDEVLNEELASEMLVYFKEDPVFKEWIKDAMYVYGEEYASLRVAQEKAQLIEKLETKFNQKEASYQIYHADGIQEAIDLIKNS